MLFNTDLFYSFLYNYDKLQKTISSQKLTRKQV